MPENEIAATAAPSKALSPFSTVKSFLEERKGALKQALPRHMTADRMLRVLLTSIQRTPKLAECDKMSLWGAVIQSAQLGLEPDGVQGQAHLIPFWNSKKNRNEVQFIIGYKGLISLARRSGEVGAIESRVVYEKDTFDFEYGLDQKLKHVPTKDPERGEITHFYAIARLKGQPIPQFEVMTRADVDAIRARSKAGGNGPWVTDYVPMGKKTVLRLLCKLLPASTELSTAIALDEKADIDLPQDMGVIVDADELGTPADDAKPLPAPPKSKSESSKTDGLQ